MPNQNPLVSVDPQPIEADRFPLIGRKPLNVILNAASVTGFSKVVDIANAKGSLELSGIWAGTATFEQSNEGTVWTAMALNPGAGGAAVTSSSGNGIWFIPTNSTAKSFRVNFAWSSGAITGTYQEGYPGT